MENQQLGDKPAVITWQQLKDFVTAIEPEYLNREVMVQISDNEYCSRLNEPSRIQNEIYVNPEDSEDAGTLEELEMIANDRDEVFDPGKYVLSMPVGLPLLWIDQE